MDGQPPNDSLPTVSDHPLKPHNLARGAFLISRSIFDSEVWLKDHIYLKAWVWMIGKANHQNVEKDRFAYQRGEFFTTYEEIRDGLKTYQHNQKNLATLKQIRVMVSWFTERGMIEKIPVKRIKSPPFSHLSPTPNGILRTEKGAYIGLRIRVVNYDIYQRLENYEGRPKGTHRGRRGADQGHNNKNEKRMNKKRNNNTIPSPNEHREIRILTFASLYNQHCLNLPKSIRLSQKRKDQIAQRLKETPDLAWWIDVFKKADEIYIPPSEKHPHGWSPDLEFIVRNEDNAIKISEGKYSQRRRFVHEQQGAENLLRMIEDEERRKEGVRDVDGGEIELEPLGGIWGKKGEISEAKRKHEEIIEK